jgi:hypothetical protein
MLLLIAIYFLIRYRKKRSTSRAIKKSKIVYEMNTEEDIEESRIYWDSSNEKFKDIVIPPTKWHSATDNITNKNNNTSMSEKDKSYHDKDHYHHPFAFF